MKKNQKKDDNGKDQLGLEQKNEFLIIMDSLFPDQKLLNENSLYRKKADFTFELMQLQGWTVKEFVTTMLEFSIKWSYNHWMPANILELKKKLFSEDDMVI